jgi:hypothetical protein
LSNTPRVVKRRVREDWELMSEAVAVGFFVLTVVFAWSGTVKLRSPARAALALVDFGLVAHVRPLLGTAAGALEVALAALLLAAGISAVGFLELAGAVTACATFVLFAILIERSLRAGKSFACFCFGDATKPLARSSFWRALALAVFALVLGVLAVVDRSDSGSANDALLEAVIAISAVAGTVLLASVRPLVRDVRAAVRLPSASAADTSGRHG